ncbi:DUF3558 domain-containing protein [Amycolatopsis sp. H20-H5]|uniref:DUF3558 domain-containing protein n=1 Tax=Amycolatopsis sp. H20-H5 TaxID=3046309 RepID=UPI002DB7B7AD|nr:DUF3558 domain-containing protein [Amycolatopsis sp. H20-H5]MEC3978799.1 DUF3558 domain-containing protein [Amycolatopsis sp. H20-H5]
MPKIRFTLIGVAFGIGLATTGCSGTSAVNGTPTAPAPSAPASTALPSDGAPAVPKALDPAALEKDPCSAMTADQVASLGKPQKSTEPEVADSGGPKCSWDFATDGPSSVTGAVFTADPSRSGISGLYSQHKVDGLTKFEPFSVDGYPGVVYDNSTNALPGQCAAAVGIRDDLTYTISVSLYSGTTPFTDGCELGKKVAGFVIEYLKKGQN